MATYSKALLSGSTNGKQINVVATGTATAAIIHTAVASTSSMDEVWLYAFSQSGATDVTICWGGTNYPDDYMTSNIPMKAGRALLVDGKLIQNGLVVRAFTTAGTVQIDGYVNQIVP